VQEIHVKVGGGVGGATEEAGPEETQVEEREVEAGSLKKSAKWGGGGKRGNTGRYKSGREPCMRAHSQDSAYPNMRYEPIKSSTRPKKQM
jgi:hypothetical protein